MARLCSGAGPAVWAGSAGLCITDSSFRALVDGVEVSDYNNIPQDADIEISYNFDVEDAANPLDDVKAGDFFHITLPDALTSIASFQVVTGQELTREWGEETYIIGNLSITAGGVATFTFHEDIEALSDVSTGFKINGAFVPAEIEDDGGTSFSLVAEGHVYEIGFEDDPPLPPEPEATIQKSGSYDPETNQVTWLVTVYSGGADVTLENVRVEDALGANQTLPIRHLQIQPHHPHR